MERIICLAVGYLFGLFQTGYLYGKRQQVDIRQHGSGNAGTTNVLRTMGWKAGAATFFGDCFKCVFAVLSAHLLYGKSNADLMPLLAMYAGAGAILGHNFPFYLKFKGGKGIAATGGLIFATSWWMTLIELVLFIGIVGSTKYVSLGSLVVVTAFTLEVIVYGQSGGFEMSQPHLYELYALVIFLMILAFVKHRANIGRLLRGTENKLSLGSGKRE